LDVGLGGYCSHGKLGHWPHYSSSAVRF